MVNGFDLSAAARAEMLSNGFQPDFPPGTDEQLAAIRSRPPAAPGGSLRDLRHLLWSSIDNDTSRDLDQIEYAERVDGNIRVLVGIADVDSAIDRGTPIDNHAADQTTTVYTAVHNFPMLPEELSTDLTSLAEGEDRQSIVIEMTVEPGGRVASSDIYRALVRNAAQLAYQETGAWLEGRAEPGPKVAASPELQAQLRVQDEASQAMRAERYRSGALNFDRVEPEPVIADGHVTGVQAVRKTRANEIIEDFMVCANETMAEKLKASGMSSIRRVVRTPERWPRIVEIAARYGTQLPEQPDSRALNDFLQARKAADPVHYPDLSLSVVKLMGPGEYVFTNPGAPDQGHFGLAAQDYTHSTAPNRRFADLVTQRLIKAVLAHAPCPYSDEELQAIAKNCTDKETNARKVERNMQKRVAAVAFQSRVGQTFHAIVTGVTPKGVFVRVPDPPVDGRLMRGEAGVDVGDQIDVTLLHTDPVRGFIDFGRS